jgi:glycosyltransferase involved in cell wall biosynthesis
LETGPLTNQALPSLHAAVGWAVAVPGNDRRVVLEAMACGVPVIGAAQGALEGLVTGATGFPVGAAGLGAALEAAAAINAQERIRRGGQARLQVLARRQSVA